jgi:hypothetical protein
MDSNLNIENEAKVAEKSLSQKGVSAFRVWLKDVSFFELLAIVFIIIGALVIIGVFGVASLDPITESGSKDILDYSEFLGGFVGSLWALAGVLLFYASLGSQKAELDDQRQLLIKQIDEIVKQTEESRKQNVMFKEQQNEETFFQLMRFQNEIVSSIVLETSEMDFSSGETIQKELTGRKTFVEYYDVFKRFFQDASDRASYSSDGGDSLKKNVESAYSNFYKEYQSELGHYFRNLYNILTFIDQLKKGQKPFFLSLLIAQLSNFELGLLFFHGLSNMTNDYKELLEKYGVLENVPTDELTSIAYYLYNKEAFGEGGFNPEQDLVDIELDESAPNIEEGILTMGDAGDEEESAWDMGQDELMSSITGKLLGLATGDTQKHDNKDSHNEDKDEESYSGIFDMDSSDIDSGKKTHEDTSEPVVKPVSTDSGDWSSNMLSLDDVSTGWEDGGDNIESDDTSEYDSLESNINQFSQEGKNDSQMANLKEAFSDMSDTIDNDMPDEEEYKKLFIDSDSDDSSKDEKVEEDEPDDDMFNLDAEEIDTDEVENNIKKSNKSKSTVSLGNIEKSKSTTSLPKVSLSKLNKRR